MMRYYLPNDKVESIERTVLFKFNGKVNFYQVLFSLLIAPNLSLKLLLYSKYL